MHKMSYQNKEVRITNLYLDFYPEGERFIPAQPATG